MSDINQLVLTGHLGQNPELVQTEKKTSESSFVKFQLAVTEKWVANGKLFERTDWFTILANGKTADAAKAYLFKGDKVTILAKLKTHKWQDKDRKNHVSINIFAENINFPDKKKEIAADNNVFADEALNGVALNNFEAV